MKNIPFAKYFTCLASLLFLFTGASLWAQETHAPLVCSGKIPAEFTTASKIKYSRSLKELQKGKQVTRRESKGRKRFALESNFALDDLLQGGRVLFNDEVSAYLGEVVQQLLRDKPLSIKQPVKVYTLRSAAVNAFASDRGEVFVTLGLLAQLENEAQLAYVLSHELVHIEKKHALNFFLKTEKLDREKKRSVLGRSAADEKLLAACAFSKEQESDADQFGLERILSTGYRTASLPVVFDVLKYGYLPFDDLPFDRDLLQSSHYRLPDEYWLEAVKPIEGIADDSDDEEALHPNLKSRRQAMQNTLAKHPDAPEKSDFLLSATRFEQVRRLARNELPLLYLHADRLPQAIYTASLLLREQPDNFSLKKCIAKALYIHAKFRNDDDYTFEGDFKQVEGHSQQVHHLLEKLPPGEAVILALHYALALHRANPEDQELRTITADLFFELSNVHENLDVFSNQLPDSINTAAAADSSAKKAVTSKYDRIREQKNKQAAAGHNDYWAYAFAGLMETETFKKYWQDAKKRHEDWKAKEDYYHSSKGKKALRRERKKGLNLGIPKIAIVNPFYLKLDERKNKGVQHLATENGQEHFRDLIREVSAKSGLKTTLLDVGELKESQVEVFNDIRFLNEWFAEQSRHFDLTLTPGYEQERLNAIAQKYGTDYFLWTGVVSLREKKKYEWLYIPASLMIFAPTLPLATYLAVKPRHEMLHYALLYDVRTGRRQVLKFEVFKRRDSDAVLKAHLYDTFMQIRRK